MTATDPDTALEAARAAPVRQPAWWRRVGRGLLYFARRSPLSAFWGCVAALIIVMALTAPAIALGSAIPFET